MILIVVQWSSVCAPFFVDVAFVGRRSHAAETIGSLGLIVLSMSSFSHVMCRVEKRKKFRSFEFCDLRRHK